MKAFVTQLSASDSPPAPRAAQTEYGRPGKAQRHRQRRKADRQQHPDRGCMRSCTRRLTWTWTSTTTWWTWSRPALDVVIRSGRLADSRLVARRLGPFRFILAGSPDYLAARGIPQSPAELAQHSCLRYRFLSSGKLEEWVLPGMLPHLPAALVCNNMEAMLGAAVAGMGLALPDFLARDALGRGELQRVLAEDLTHTGAVFCAVGVESAVVA
ncbi:Endothelin-converting enzyme-like 1 [Manis javanica]|nr:Endothelin-converting enzyme-like 1 [Manis javanica]